MLCNSWPSVSICKTVCPFTSSASKKSLSILREAVIPPPFSFFFLPNFYSEDWGNFLTEKAVAEAILGYFKTGR